MIFLEWGKAIAISKSATARIALLSTGTLSVYADQLSAEAVDTYHFPFIKPLDSELLGHISKNYDAVITLEEGTIEGSWGQGLVHELHLLGFTGYAQCLGVEDKFIPQGKVSELYNYAKLDLARVEQVLEDTLNRLI